MTEDNEAKADLCINLPTLPTAGTANSAKRNLGNVMCFTHQNKVQLSTCTRDSRESDSTRVLLTPAMGHDSQYFRSNILLHLSVCGAGRCRQDFDRHSAKIRQEGVPPYLPATCRCLSPTARERG